MVLDGTKKDDNASSTIQSTNPAYYIHPSDDPSRLYVSELLTDQNYGEWVDDMTNSLLAKNKIGFVDGKLTRPATEDKQLSEWIRCDAMVKGWLKSGMEKEVRSSVRFAKTARQIWVALEERFGTSSASRVYELRRSVTLLHQEKLTVSAFYTKLRGLWEELQAIVPIPQCSCSGCTCDVEKQNREIREREQVIDFLLGLDDAFATVRSQVLAMKPTPTLAEAYQLVANDEKQRLITTSRRPNIDAASFTHATNHGRIVPLDAEVPRCEHCHKEGHVKAHCYELIGYPEPRKRSRRQGDKVGDVISPYGPTRCIWSDKDANSGNMKIDGQVDEVSNKKTTEKRRKTTKADYEGEEVGSNCPSGDDCKQTPVLNGSKQMIDMNAKIWNCMNPSGVQMKCPYSMVLLRRWLETRTSPYIAQYKVWRVDQSKEEAVVLDEAIRQAFGPRL